MSDLTEFLLARVAEDEEVAREIADEMVRVASQYLPGAAPNPDDRGLHAFEDGDNSPAVVISPARILAECKAKRRIVEDFEVYAADARIDRTEFAAGRRHAALLAVTRLAEVHAAHPDYDEAWRP